MQFKSFLKYFLSTAVIALILSGSFVHAETIEELTKKISDQKSYIEQINRDIAEKQKDLLKVGAEKSSLQQAIRQLEGSKRKVETDLKLTESKISTAELTLRKLSLQIDAKKEKIDNESRAIASSIRKINESESETLLETLLSTHNLSLVFDTIESHVRFQESVRLHMDQLSNNKKELEGHKTETETMKSTLLGFKKELFGQKQSLETTKKEKAVILSETQNKEATYKKIIAEKQALADAFAKELFNYEAKLKIAIDPKSFPSAQSSLLAWPVDKVIITQYFGRTTDAKRLYVSGTHNGVDFGVPDGTALKAVLGGVIEGVGDTDGGGCYSYGKWILIKHANGLSSLYGHLSAQNVNVGDAVTTGQVIGYSGRTGYSTGPHLHLTIYASQGVQITQYTSSTGCKNKSIPIADPKAYLDPMLYLPRL